MKFNKHSWDLCPILMERCYNSRTLIGVRRLKKRTLEEQELSKSDYTNRGIKIRNKRRRLRVRVPLIRTLCQLKL